jgi:Protein of unknown function (DUF3800)
MMYVDESGDTGFSNSPTRYFVLTGIVIHESSWKKVLSDLVNFRQKMRAGFGLKLREEIHAAAMINKPGKLARIKRNERLLILRNFANTLAVIPEVRIINIVIDKSRHAPNKDIFSLAWGTLIQRFENTMFANNFPVKTSPTDTGIILPDHTDDKKLSSLLRKMRYYNPIPYAGGSGYTVMPVKFIIEDPMLKDSSNSYFIQAADVVAYLLYQKLNPNKYVKKGGGHKFFDRLLPVLCLQASKSDPFGIVMR